MQRKNEGRLRYLENVTQIFDGGVIFELHLLEHFFRYWTETGIYAARYTNIADVEEVLWVFDCCDYMGTTYQQVEYALSFPWYASHPCIETRFYEEQYGRDDDLWLAKTQYTE
ncbi:hypothetical protein QJS10_CPA03g00935 [Acorus calamus]|uniref:Uncharacterized protein n=1 Tax=Acorus calamus TaxID=4465 RepID=A0AAV9F2D3_ACOCL|nr:hypothetical protein QJS10_CPA03g00935 [Acorus calamus]